MSIEAMKQALNALEGWDNYGYWVWPETALEQCKRNTKESLSALRQAIEQAEKQEPVTWDGGCVLGHCGCPDGCDRSGCCRANLAPRKEWVGLTELEIKHYNSRLSGSGVAQEIEEKLRERNT